MKLSRNLAVLFALIAILFAIAAGNSAFNAHDFTSPTMPQDDPWLPLQILSRGLLWATLSLISLAISALLWMFGSRRVSGENRA